MALLYLHIVSVAPKSPLKWRETRELGAHVQSVYDFGGLNLSLIIMKQLLSHLKYLYTMWAFKICTLVGGDVDFVHENNLPSQVLRVVFHKILFVKIISCEPEWPELR